MNLDLKKLSISLAIASLECCSTRDTYHPTMEYFEKKD
jgi:hypothetical protein